MIQRITDKSKERWRAYCSTHVSTLTTLQYETHINKFSIVIFNLDQSQNFYWHFFKNASSATSKMDFMAQQIFKRHHHQHDMHCKMRIFAYLMDLFVESRQQQVSEWRWAVKRAMIFESVEICAGVDVANEVLCNYNPYFMVVGWVLWNECW